MSHGAGFGPRISPAIPDWLKNLRRTKPFTRNASAGIGVKGYQT
jgi:hypothetical protein